MRRRLVAEDLYSLQLPAQPAISPQGDRVVYVMRITDREADEDHYTLWLAGSLADEPVQLTRGPHDTSPAWSPDGTRVAFLRLGESDHAQVWLLPLGGGEPQQLTRLPLGAGTPRWSPDGAQIAFAAPVDGAAVPGEDDTQANERRARSPVVADRLDRKVDGVGLLGPVRPQFFVADARTGEARQVTRGDLRVGGPAWSPDGTRLAFTAAPDDADLTMESAAYIVDLTEGDPQPRLVGDPHGMAERVGWIPDGSALLVVGRRDVEAGHALLLRVPLDGSDPTDLTAALDRNVMPGHPGYPGGEPQVTHDGKTILFCARDRGCTNLYAVRVDGGEVRTVLGGAGRVVSGLSAAARADRAAVVVATPAAYGEVCLIDLTEGVEQVLTAHMAPSLPDLDLLTARERVFTVSDGTSVQGWLLRDPEAPTPAPLLVDVHGGPHNAWNAAADPVRGYHQVLAARGWTVLLLNPRGSDGYGESFYRAVAGAWGAADERDFLEPVEELIADGVADPERVALTGYSYGGFMTCWLTTRSSRFTAAAAGGVVTDLASLTGTSDLGHAIGTLELGASLYDDPDRYAAHSPITHVAHVNTPTLILHGGADERCPVGQAEQWFTALRQRGVSVRLVTYPAGSHLFILDGRPSHRVDYSRRVVDWVTRHAATTRHTPLQASAAGIDAGHWQRRLTELATGHGIPGAALGILHGDEVVEAVHGVVSTATGVEVTPDTVFQIGSITKVWTATAAMQLVDEGLLDLDAPLVEVLPELTLSDPLVAKRVTLRHLLTHTSGVDGDVFTDTGRGDDCLERYVRELCGVAQNHPMGALFSYCNSGFILAGRAIEKLAGSTWDAAVRERIVEPLGLTHTVTLPEEAIRFRAAVGHVGEPGAPHPARTWGLPRCCGPAGLICSAPRELLTFARMHMRGGEAPDGTRVLSETSAAAMQASQVDVPANHMGAKAWGLGWGLFDWDGHRFVGHDGGTLGQTAFLRVLPEQHLAIALLTNTTTGGEVYQELFREILCDLAGIEMPPPLEPPARPPAVDLGPYVGRYERAGARLELSESNGRLALRHTVTGPLAALVEHPTEEFTLIPLQEGHFVARRAGENRWAPVSFHTLDDGSSYVHFHVRATPKMA